MKIVNLISYLDRIDGSFSSIYDLHLNLLKFGVHNTLYVIINDYSIMPILNRYYNTSLICFYNNLPKEILHDSIVISSVDSIRYLNYSKLSFRSLILLDSALIYILQKNNQFIDSLKYLIKYTNCYIFGNTFNKKILGGEKYFQYYHKFSSRLNSLPISDKKGVLDTLSNIYKQKNIKDIHPFDYRGLNYSRWCKTLHDTYYENIGKMIFEFLYNNKEVYYNNRKDIDDGLTEYLNIFDVDDNKSQKLYIKPEDITEKLFFNGNDKILEFIS